MAYIMNPSALMVSVSMKCGGKIVESDNDAVLGILGLLLPRLEDLMAVASLTYGETTDTFEFFDDSTDISPASNGRIRLSNGYVENSEVHPVTILDPDGEAVTDFFLNERDGVITLESWKKGRYTVAYYAGLKTVENEAGWAEGDPEFLDAPAWMQGVVVELFVMWNRTVPVSLKLPEQISYAELVHQADKELKRRVYQRYQRPRDVDFPIRSVRTDGVMV